MNAFTVSRIVAACTLVLLMTGGAYAAESVPVLPHIFFGQVEVGGQPAPVGTVIEAKCTGILTGTNYNPITVAEAGKYGVPGATGTKLLVQGDIASGTAIEFYVGGSRAQCYDTAATAGWVDTYPFKSGEVTNLNLRVAETGGAGSTTTPTPTATAAVSTIPTTSGSYTGGGGGGGGGGGSVGSSSSSESSVTGTVTTMATSTITATATATQGGAGTGITASSTQVPETPAGTGTPTQEPTIIATQSAPAGTGQPIPVSWIIGIIIVVIIIGGGAYYYYSRQKPPEKKE